MRKLFAMATCGLLAACSTTPEYHIAGTASTNLNGQTVFLQTLNEDATYVSIDSTVVTDGKFEFKGVAQQPEIALLTTAEKKGPKLTFILENGQLTASLDQENTIAGTPANDSLQSYANYIAAQGQQMQAIVEEYRAKQQDSTLTPEYAQQLMAGYDSIATVVDNYDSLFIAANSNSLAGTYVLSRSLSGMSAEEVEGFVSKSSPAFQATPLMGKITNFLEAAKRSSIGAEYTNLTMPNLEGEEVSLSNYIGHGKYVLVDFWASWCGPCRREMPVLVDAYKKYADKGFEIVGVSFDDNHEAWAAGVKELNITWPQMSDLKGWKSEAASVYGIRSIPATLLFDPQGKIVAKDLRGEQLNETLATYLDK